MKEQIAQLLVDAVNTLLDQGELSVEQIPTVQVDHARDKKHGDYASNLALVLAKPARTNPRVLAEKLINALPKSPIVKNVELAGPGFINFFVDDSAVFSVIGDILSKGEEFGRAEPDSKPSIQVEFVSANPTGPLHVGHGRGAAYGATVADLLEATGHKVDREYYVNDAGRQMDILAVSVWLRYLEYLGATLKFPANGYQGAYVNDIAHLLAESQGDTLQLPLDQVFSELPPDEPEGGDKEKYIDALIGRTQDLLKERYVTLFTSGLDSILADIREDLGEFGIEYQTWFSERSLTENADVEEALRLLSEKGHLYEQEGNLWFRSTEFGDDKDRVVRRANGQTTYFASDIAYHRNKFERGYDQVVNVWGADHHGYITRVKAAISALGYDPERLIVKLVQFAILYRSGERVPMSTRSGSFVTLRELRDEVGDDACRFFYVTRKADQHMDFDLDLAKSESKDNPVYYIQYAHARICSILGKLQDQDLSWDQQTGLSHLELLESEAERDLVTQLQKYPETLNQAGVHLEPHTLANYLRDLASDFHAYYNGTRLLVVEDELRNARVTLSMAVRQVLFNGLTLLGVNAPEKM